MSKFLREEDISAGFRSPLYSVLVDIPLCNVCVYWNGPGKCKKCGVPSEEIRWGKCRDCPDAVLNTSHFLYPKYQNLYPEECKVLAKK